MGAGDSDRVELQDVEEGDSVERFERGGIGWTAMSSFVRERVALEGRDGLPWSLPELGDDPVACEGVEEGCSVDRGERGGVG